MYSALAKAIGKAADDAVFRLICVDGDDFPEVLISGQDGSQTLVWYSPENASTDTQDLADRVFFIPKSGQILAEKVKDTAGSSGGETEAASLETLDDTLYTLSDGAIFEEGTASNVFYQTKGTQTLTVNGRSTDRKGYLSFFDFDHAFSVSAAADACGGYSKDLCGKILKDHGKINRTGDLSLYLDCIRHNHDKVKNAGACTSALPRFAFLMPPYGSD